jgi:hypothetical protein
MADRQGVEIDYCPQCRGVWLDRGELDKIIERSTVAQQPVVHQQHVVHSGHHDPHYYKHHKQKSLLHELFDF